MQSEVATCCEQSMEAFFYILFFLRSGWDPGLGIEEWGKETKDCLQAQREKDGIGSCATGHWRSSLRTQRIQNLSPVHCSPWKDIGSNSHRPNKTKEVNEVPLGMKKGSLHPRESRGKPLSSSGYGDRSGKVLHPEP